jgi:hypothetical protein
MRAKERSRPGRRPVAALGAAVAFAALGVAVASWAQPTTANAPATLAPLTDEAGTRLAPPWRFVGLPQQPMPATRFEPVRIEGAPAVRIEAPASYGNLVHEWPAGAAMPGRFLAWRWRVDRPNPAADLRTKAGDDVAAKVCASFDHPLEAVPFVERQLMRLARSRTGENLPAATLCWVWAAKEAPGDVIDNAYTRRVRYLVLRGSADGTARWADERRDVEADLRRAFGDEIAPGAMPPALTALIVGADADNTRATTVAHVAALRFEP